MQPVVGNHFRQTERKMTGFKVILQLNEKEFSFCVSKYRLIAEAEILVVFSFCFRGGVHVKKGCSLRVVIFSRCNVVTF
jgi:hypothetical protein